MAAVRLPMRKLREVVRLKLQGGWSGRAIARSCGLSPSTIGTYFGRIALAKLLRRLAKTAVLVVDDFGLEVLTAPQRRDFLEVLEPRWTGKSGQ